MRDGDLYCMPRMTEAVEITIEVRKWTEIKEHELRVLMIPIAHIRKQFCISTVVHFKAN